MSEEENVINEEKGKQLLSSIFQISIKEKDKYYPIIEESTNISNLLLFLKNENNNYKEKKEILFILLQLFKENEALIPLFMSKNITNEINLYEPLIDLYFNSKEKEIKALVEQLIQIIVNNATLTKTSIEYLFQKLSQYFERKELDDKGRLDEDEMMKYLNLFLIFYTGFGIEISEKNIIEKISHNLTGSNDTSLIPRAKEIKNYIYFSGKRSCISLALNKNSINPNTDYPTLQYGLSFIMWVYFDEYLIKKFQENNSNQEIKLSLINISGEQIKLVLKDINTFQVSLNDNEVKNINSSLIIANDWNNICFSIIDKKDTKLSFKLYVNSGAHSSFLNVGKNFPISKKINTIKLFENFIGKVSSFMIITKGLDQKEANYFSNTKNSTKDKKNYGFYKNKYLFNFLLSNEKNYFSNCKNYKYYEKCISSKVISFYNLHLDKQNIKNMIGIFCPFSYNKDENQIDDIFGNFIGVLGENDGVNYYINNSKRIRQLGGINNLLPIIELMYSTISQSKKSKYLSVDKSVLTESTFYEYLNLIKKIIIDHSENLKDANREKFFSSLSLFLEKCPSHLFTQKILEIFIEIGKETFKNIDELNLNFREENFIYLILLNEKILSKYDIESQIILWKNIYSFFTSDETQLKGSFNINKICLILRLVDEKRYSQFCCKDHANVFKKNNSEENNNDLSIMEPEMNVRLNELFKIIQIYINKYCDEEETVGLLQLLSLDLSPCLQKKIIELYINYFSNEKIESKTKLKSFDILLKNNFIELIEYVFSISLLDIRIIILSLLKLFLSNKYYKHKFHKHMNKEVNGMNNFYNFISENLLPEQLYIEIEGDENKKKDLNEKEMFLNNLLINNMGKIKKKELIPLSTYFNKIIYEKEVFNIWNMLLKWLMYKGSETHKSDKKKERNTFYLNNFILDFCISFCSKSPFNVIDLFMLTLISYFKDESIQNRDILYSNKNLFPWLIETIFYFWNTEINDHIYKKEHVLSIQKNSLDLFVEFFIHRRPHEEINKRIYYIIRYSTHLKKIYGDINNKKIKEITRIARQLLEKIMEVSSLHMNHKAKCFFDFIIFHKNYDKLTGAKKNISNTNLARFDTSPVLRKTITNEGFAFGKTSLFLDKLKEDNIILEEDNKQIKRNDDFNQKTNINSINLNEINTSISEENKFNDPFINDGDIIPSYIYSSLHCDQLPGDGNNDNFDSEDDIGGNLKFIWDDFSLYDGIIDYYSSNVWGTENLKKKVKIENDGNDLSSCRNLIKEYGENKEYRNILIKDVLKCFNIKYSSDSIKEEKVKINILNINAILLCIAMTITKDYEESVFLEGKFQQFIIFCILVSININVSDIYYDLIQSNLYDVLGFSFIFLKKRNKKKYDKLIDNFIIPILKMDDPKKINLFKNKKTIKSSAIYKLFEFREKKKDEAEEMDDFFRNTINFIGHSATKNFANINFDLNEQKDIIPKKKIKDDSNIDLKDINNNLKVVFKGEKNLILKHLFEDYLSKVKEERKEKYRFKTNYKNIYNNNVFINRNNLSDEKKRINLIIKKLLGLYETQIKNYANNEYLQTKKRRNKYKNIKSKLFSWRGFWSNKYLFYEHPELLKLKMKNHYTKEMIRPLLVPILDIDYYTPNFKKFDKSKLFNENNYKYTINLDIDDILNDENEKPEINQPENNNIINIKDNEQENNYELNFLESIYKLSYDDLWEKYKSFPKIDFEKLISLKKESYTMLVNSKKMSKNIEDIQRENIYNCCIVKMAHHLKGYISTEKYRIRFIFASDSDIKEEELENDIYYDKEMQCCFGSIFKNKKNDKDKVVISIDYTEIKYIFIRQYFYMKSSLEIFTEKNKSYFFNFKRDTDLTQFKNDILHHGTYREIKAEDYKGKKIIGYEKANSNSKKKTYYVTNKMEEWQKNNISTLEYLMWLNIYSGRSFNDLTQYPIFPWIITNYSDDTENISIETDLRNLSIPMGMMDISDKAQMRKDTFIETYESIRNDLEEMFPDFNYRDYLKKGDEYLDNYKTKKSKTEKEEEIAINQIPYFYGSHYSNPTYVSHFLTRIFPYSYVAIEIQGEKFDDPDRIFTSMQKTFESVTTLKDDLRELIPEFYMLPELFLNNNNLNLAQNKLDSENNLIIINDVKLPLWCNNNAITFVVELRRYLESTNFNLNKWIDLIFGVAQRGEKAEENHNIFQAYTYENNVKINSIEDIDSRNALMRQSEMGVVPFQIFDEENKNKIKNNSNNIMTLDESKNLIIKKIKSNRFTALESKKYQNDKLSNDPMYKEENVYSSHLKIIKIACLDGERIKIFTNKSHWYVIKIEEEDFINNNNFLKIEESNYYKFQNNSNKYACSYMISDIENPVIVFNNSQCLLKGGFWDGRLELNNLNLDTKEDPILLAQTIFNPNYSPIVVMEKAKSEKFLFCGTMDGNLISYKINQKIIEFKRSLCLFDSEITSISINEKLNMFAVSSKDGFVNLHILPTYNLVRTICLKYNKKNNINKNENENEKNSNLLYANNIFLSSSPLGCITVYINSKKLFKSFTLNGEFICECKECDESSNIKSPIIYTNNSFQDILVYGTNDGFIKFRKFPEMSLINSIEVFPGEEINTICITPDNKLCYAWSSNNIISVIKISIN